MATKRKNAPVRGRGRRPAAALAAPNLATSIDDLLLAALARGGDTLETGRLVVCFAEGQCDQGAKMLKSMHLRVADARDFAGQAMTLEDAGGADAMVLPEIGVAVIGGDALAAHGVTKRQVAAGEPVQTVEPEYFVFAENAEYLRGFAAAANAIARDLGGAVLDEPEAEVLGVTWGLEACRVPRSARTGAGIKVAVLDTGFDLGHPDFAGRAVTSRSFVGQPVQDLNGHGTHCVGTACGPLAPAGSTPRFGVAHAASVFVGKVLSNAGSGSSASVLAGMNWAIANRCQVISMSLGSQSPVQTAYTNAGAAALRNGCLIVAASGNENASTGAPANSPTILSVASLDPNLRRSSFSNFGKVELAAPGRDVFSAWPRPIRYRSISGTSMATPHVAGCAALWAQSSASLRGMALWRQLQASARALAGQGASRVGSGLVQAP
jgi:subtilisin family serine protease